ncbi:DNA polymerase II small subunit, partial [Halorussus sp. GCM10023401]
METPGRIVSELTSRGYNADREAVTLLAGADDPAGALEAAVERAPADAFKLSADHVRSILEEMGRRPSPVSNGADSHSNAETTRASPVETKGVENGAGGVASSSGRAAEVGSA